MFIELVDALRCPNRHEESWLVASANRMDARHIVDGTLGCPVCKAEFPIANGVVDFRQHQRAAVPENGARAREDPVERSEGTVCGDAMKLAALLDLSDGHGFAVLLGQWGALANDLTAVAETPLMVVDPPEGIVGSPGISVIRCDGEIPLANGAARAIAIDAASASRVRSALRIVKPRGRVVSPNDIDVPGDVKELARDQALWVGERDAPTSPIISLHVRRS